MSASNEFETALLTLIYNNTAIAKIGDATGLPGSASAGSFYVALHTADPGEAGEQTTSEATYTNYARVPVARTAAGWTVAGNAVSNFAEIAFPTCGVTGNSITNWSVGTDATLGAGLILFKGASVLAVSNGITPKFAAGTLTNSVD